MPVVPFETLPDVARVWVFGSDKPLSDEGAGVLLEGVDEHLEGWKAHGAPLTVAREWRDGRFLVVAVDQSTAGASGCSIDGLFRVLQQLERRVGANLVGGGRVFYRDNHGVVQCVSRAEIAGLARDGAITEDTVVFDTSLTDLGTWRTCFERPAKECWVKDLF
ncbi:MAG: hypothetical protein JWM95_4955 [Gemmatimonadetes bacterium]|nr:hypothetical protein [Gemmatimonadota bacterium]